MYVVVCDNLNGFNVRGYKRYKIVIWSHADNASISSQPVNGPIKLECLSQSSLFESDVRVPQ
jgi:hypothetical protein